MRTRWTTTVAGVALAGVAGVAGGCGAPADLGTRATASSARAEHDRAVAELERRAEEEAGWVVLEVPNIHEGGGTTTWWLHPCDSLSDLDRAVTRTAYHGSDVASLPGQHTVETDTVGCDAPGRDLRLDDRLLTVDRAVVRIGPTTWALLEPAETLTITDVGHGSRHDLEAPSGTETRGPCDGTAAWSAQMRSRAELAISSASCAGSLAALPSTARDLLDLPADQHADHDHARLSASRIADLDEALRGAGWEADEIALHGFDGTSSTPIWFGPCRPAHDGDGQVRTSADWHAGHLETRELGCD